MDNNQHEHEHLKDVLYEQTNSGSNNVSFDSNTSSIILDSNNRQTCDTTDPDESGSTKKGQPVLGLMHNHHTTKDNDEQVTIVRKPLEVSKLPPPDSCTLDNVVLTPDNNSVQSICGWTTFTVRSLRTFARNIKNLGSGYSSAKKEELLQMIADRKKGNDALTRITMNDQVYPSSNDTEEDIFLKRKQLKMMKGKKPQTFPTLVLIFVSSMFSSMKTFDRLCNF